MLTSLLQQRAQKLTDGARLLAGLADLGITSIAAPGGAFYLYADVGHLTQDSLAFCIRLVEETGVALAPGIDFDPEQGHRFVRFSFAVYPEEVERALALLAAWLPNGVAAQGMPADVGPGRIAWFDLSTTDLAKSRVFFAAVTIACLRVSTSTSRSMPLSLPTWSMMLFRLTSMRDAPSLTSGGTVQRSAWLGRPFFLPGLGNL